MRLLIHLSPDFPSLILRAQFKRIGEIIDDNSYQRYYMHKTSHWLGADVHDAGLYRIQNQARPLEPGFVLTVEPGLYIRADDENAPQELRGCGIRIEDDVLISSQGPRVLSAGVPKQVSELEALIGQQQLGSLAR